MNKPPDTPRKVLGKGLSALLPARSGLNREALKSGPDSSPSPERDSTTNGNIPLSLIDPNPLQPRTVFDPTKLAELAASIKANGVIQPLIVRRKGSHFELIAGERRLRAAQEAGLNEVPVIVQDYADNQLLEIALIENIQREDLNPIEAAQALDRLARDSNISYEELGARTGKDRTTISNLVRLLKLPHEVQLLLAERRLAMGHARAILGLNSAEEQKALAEHAVKHGYSVREVERAVQDRTEHRERSKPKEKGRERADPNIAAAVSELESALGTRVRIVEKTNQRGRIEIEYYSQDDLNRLYEFMISAVQR
jgi:ParB family chromosome partitioning protein